jgi:exosortase
MTAKTRRRKNLMWRKLSLHLTKSQLSLAIKIVAMLATTIVLFSQDLTILFSDAVQNETTSYLLAMPFLFAYLIYRKRKMLRAVIPLGDKNQPREKRYLPTISGILLSVTAILLYWHGSYTFTPLEYHMIALPLFAAGLTLIIFNLQTFRQLAFPIAFLVFLMPPPTEFLYNIGATLSVVSSEASNAIVNTFGIPSTIISEYGNPTIIITQPDGTVIPFTVDIACSGIYALIGFLIFAVFVAYIIRDKLWKKLALILIGVPLIYSLNIVRITIILTLGYHFGEDLALQIFHLLGGWILIFFGTLLLLMISERMFKTQIFAKPSDKCLQCNPKSQSSDSFCSACGRILNPGNISIDKIDVVKIASIAISVILLMSIQVPVFALTEASPIVIVDTPSGQQFSTGILPEISNYNLSFWYRDTQFEIRAKEDFSLVYLYMPVNESKEPIWVTIEIAPTRSSLHAWETCLITWPTTHGGQAKVTQIELKDVQLTENPPIISRYFVFNYTLTEETQAILYWYESSKFTINSTVEQKYVKISLIAYPENTEDLPNIENQLLTMAVQVANYWQPIKTWSQVTMLISQNGANFALATTALLITIIFYYVLETRRQKKANGNAYQKLSKQNKQIIDIVQQTEKTSLPTLRNIATTYEKTIGKRINNDQLLKKLSEIENTGIVKSYIANKQDEPVNAWSIQL